MPVASVPSASARTRVTAARLVAGLFLTSVAAAGCGGDDRGDGDGGGERASAPVIGLITKTETNPFFVKMREGAQAKADELGLQLMACAGKFDGDNDGQVACIENQISAGAKDFAIEPSDSPSTTYAPPCIRPTGCVLPSTGSVATERSMLNSVNSMPIFSARAPIPRAVAQSSPSLVVASLMNPPQRVSVVLVRLTG